MARMTTDELTEQLLTSANQLIRGVDLVVDPDEKLQVATLALRAGRRAKASAAYASGRCISRPAWHFSTNGTGAATTS